MNASPNAAIALYAAGACGLAALAAVLGRPSRRALTGALIVLETALVAHALLGAAALPGGQRAAEPATHAGYLAASVLVLPIALGPAAGQSEAWRATIIAVGCLAVLVVSLRMSATWGHPR
jgi:hypothetical protein